MFVYNKLPQRNIYSIQVVHLVHIQSNAGESGLRLYAKLLSYKKDQKLPHNQEGRVHPGKRYGF